MVLSKQASTQQPPTIPITILTTTMARCFKTSLLQATTTKGMTPFHSRCHLNSTNSFSKWKKLKNAGPTNASPAAFSSPPARSTTSTCWITSLPARSSTRSTTAGLTTQERPISPYFLPYKYKCINSVMDSIEPCEAGGPKISSGQ